MKVSRSKRPKVASDSQDPGTTVVVQAAFALPCCHFPKQRSSFTEAEEQVPLYKIVPKGSVKTELGRQRAEMCSLHSEICSVTEKIFLFVYQHLIQFSYRPTQYPSEGGIFLGIKIFGGQNNRKMSHLSKETKRHTF